MINQLQNLIVQLSGELPGILAAAVVTVEDGMSIAEVSRDDDIEPAVAAAYLASIVKSNSKAINLLADDEVVDDILITTSKYHFIIRHVDGEPFFVFLMTTRLEWLGKARKLIQKYEVEFTKFSGYLEESYS